MGWKSVLILVVAGLSTAEPSAQGQRGKFSTAISSVKELHLETARLDEQAQRCGLIAGDLETPARLALEASTLKMSQSSTNFVFVNANVVATADACAAAIDVELFRWSNDYRSSVSVWARKAVITGGRSGFNSRVREKVDTMTKDFIAEWQKARQ